MGCVAERREAGKDCYDKFAHENLPQMLKDSFSRVDTPLLLLQPRYVSPLDSVVEPDSNRGSPGLTQNPNRRRAVA